MQDAHAFDDDDLDWHSVDPRVEPYLRAWQAFRANTGVVPITRERMVLHPGLWFAGTLDGVFLTQGGIQGAHRHQNRRSGRLRLPVPDGRVSGGLHARAPARHHRRPLGRAAPARTSSALRHPPVFRVAGLARVPGVRHHIPTSGGPAPRQGVATWPICSPPTSSPWNPTSSRSKRIRSDIALEPDEPVDTEAATVAAALVSTALIEVLPADFPLPVLARFVPNQALRTAVAEVCRDLLAIDVTAADGVDKADTALGLLRERMKAVDAHFDEPARIAYELHRHITGMRADFNREGVETQKTMARRLFDETERRQAIERERLRREQQEANERERERLRLEAAEAAKHQAPPAVVEQMQQEAETATAPPVGTRSTPATTMRNSTVTKTWKARVQGTPATDEPNPETADLNAAQRHQVLEAMKAIIDGRAPLAVFAINWSYLNKRAAADKSAMGIPGFEAFQVGGLRAKGSRS
jgi:hypothetical protein